MARKRVVRSAGTKAKVALAAMSGMSPSQIANRFGVHPTQVAQENKGVRNRIQNRFLPPLLPPNKPHIHLLQWSGVVRLPPYLLRR